MKLAIQALGLAVVASASTFSFAEVPTSPHSVSGNISVLSSYILRGNTAAPENTEATLQGGLDYSHSSGLYAGWWTSTLGTDAYGTTNPMENNFYVGYNGSINENTGFTVGTTYYYYYDVETSVYDGFELLLGLNYKDVGVTAQTLLEDTGWGNAGDTYLKATYSYPLPNDFSLDTALGLYVHEKDGKYVAETPESESFNFRHFDIGLSKALGETGVTASMNYIIGGDDRYGNNLKNKMVLALGYSF
ncbi:TorF family putative porin [Acinetobacter sp. DSM 11652]|uniref:TorF family putative porin n=1 Tax=Acinetobacter sp. DSM 11652 TaxID=346222 RepID=UPI0008C732B8|nr:TorF family putative porin [Acinetobacter sp. DSM 11652]SEL96723.1 conserved hypothetical protein [Acinetobacter sp. DSM 11652]